MTVDPPLADPLLLERFRELIRARTGLSLRAPDLPRLRRVLATRAAALGVAGPEAYGFLLEGSAPEAEAEWKELAALLTIGESYFFRDEGQFSLLRRRLLPDLIARRRAAKSLRLWSAGCSTGEEPYSLAILLAELLQGDPGWSVTILGTDLNERALRFAREGVYGSWSLRALPPEHRWCFRPWGEDWRLDERIRDAVSFRPLNLIEDRYPNPALDLHAFDLIVCRNVFIYFAPGTTARVVEQLAACLREGGYLLTGHAELTAPSPAGLRRLAFPESTVYQRATGQLRPDPAERPRAAPSLPPRGTQAGFGKEAGRRPVSPDPPAGSGDAGRDRQLGEAEEALRRGEYRLAIELAEQALAGAEALARALFLIACAQACLGDYAQAESCCARALEADPAQAAPYLVLAQIEEERGAVEEAVALLRKALYVDPSCAAAYVQLAALYDNAGDPARARRMLRSAIRALRSLPPEAPVPPFGETRAGELAEHLERALAGGA